MAIFFSISEAVVGCPPKNRAVWRGNRKVWKSDGTMEIGGNESTPANQFWGAVRFDPGGGFFCAAKWEVFQVKALGKLRTTC